ncbi:MAG: WecB/TagA/CpsF family glycosyltransferase [Bacillota bacterium]
MTEIQDILGIKFNNYYLKDFINEVYLEIKHNQEYNCRYIVTPNAEIVMQARKNNAFKEVLNSAWLSSPDGSGILLASKLLPDKVKFKERVAGFDLMKGLLQLANQEGLSLYMLGGGPEVIGKAADNIEKSYPDLKIKGYHHGYLDDETREKIIGEIAQARADILLIGMGAPRQELFLFENKDRLQVKVALTIGGSLDIFAGSKKRAPRVMQRLYLEWLFRFMQEPSRWKRILVLPHFLLIILLKAILQRVN